MQRKRPARINIGIDLDRRAIEKARPPAESLEQPSGAGGDRHEGRGDADATLKTVDGALVAPLVRIYTSPAQYPTSGPGILDPGSNLQAGPHFVFQEGNGVSWLEQSLLFLRAFGRWSIDGPALIYCDPPYMRHTCASRCRYKYDMTDVDHQRLLRVLQELNALPDPPFLMISGYESKLYQDAFEPSIYDETRDSAQWRHMTFQAITRGGTKATEHLWFNFPPPQVLHDYRYYGTNFRDRERMKRRQVHWANRLKKMPETEKLALLAAIQQSRVTLPQP